MRLLLPGILLFTLLAGLAGIAGQPNPLTYAQGDSTPTPAPGEDLQRLFASDLQPAFQPDVLRFPNAPVYQGNFEIVFTANEARLLGTLNVLYTNQTGETLNEIVFRLYPNLPSYGGVMTIHSAQFDNALVTPELDETQSVLTLHPDQPVLPMQQNQITLQFDTTVPANAVNLYAQYSYLFGGALALANAFPLLSVYENGAWWQETAHSQGDAVYSETSYFDMQITVPQEWVVIASGISLESHLNADKTRTTRYLAGLMRDFAFMASPYYSTLNGQTLGVNINVHYFVGGETAAQSALDYALDAIETYTNTFGAYSYTQLDIVETFTEAGGIEYPGLIVVANNIWNSQEPYFEFVIAHEIAHQWWYALVGNDQTAEPWLDEALAQYSVALYFNEKDGEKGYNNTIISYENGWETYIDGNTGIDLPVGLAVKDYPKAAYFQIVYRKGPVFYDLLADTFGQNQLNAALAVYFNTYRYQIATTADLQAILEANLNADLDTYFTEWILPE